MKTCSRCGATKPLDGFHNEKVRKDGLNPWCKPCVLTYNKERYAANPDSGRCSRYRRLYGITVADYDRMFDEQGGVCLICQTPCRSGMRLAVDHDHKTGVVRGLLCYGCNTFLGRLEANWEKFRRTMEYIGQDFQIQRIR